MERGSDFQVLYSVEYQTVDKVQEFSSLENKFLVIHPSFKNIAYEVLYM
jgi:hypothetical protein